MRFRLLVYFFALVIGTFIFHQKVGIDKLNPQNDSWLTWQGMDRTADYLAWTYFKQNTFDEYPDTLGFAYPLKVSPIHTSILPIVAYPAKWISKDGGVFQYFGWWYYSCFILLIFFGVYLLETMGVRDPVLIALGSLFFLLNLSFFNRIDHVALTHHWMIIAGLIPFFKNWKPIKVWGVYVLLAIVAALTHPYMIVFGVGLPFFYTLQQILWKKNYGRLNLSIFPSTVVVTVLLLWMLGAFAFDASTATEDGFGFYSANLNTFYNNFGKTNAPLHFKTYYSGAYEGMAYLGLGLLILLGLVFVFNSKELSRFKVLMSKRWLGLSIGVAVFTLFSFSNVWTFHSIKLIEWPTFGLEGLFSIFRSTGRYIWLFYYLFIGIIILAWDTTMLSVWVKRVVLFLLIGVQLWDVYPAMTYKIPENNIMSTYIDAGWEDIISPFQKIVSFPPFERQLDTYDDVSQIIYLASKYNIPMSAGHLARASWDQKFAFENQIKSYLNGEDQRPDAFDSTLFITTKEFYPFFKDKVDQNELVVRKSLNYLLLTKEDTDNKLSSALKNATSYFDPMELNFLSDWVANQEHKELIFLAHDDATYSVSERFKEWMSEEGSEFRDLPLRHAFVGILDSNGLVREASDAHSVSDSLRIGNQQLYFHSSGNAAKQKSFFSIKGQLERELKRGLTVLAIDRTEHNIRIGHFDTYVSNVLVSEEVIDFNKD